MRPEYEDIVRYVCGDDWNAGFRSADDKDGAFGVAIVLAFIRGTKGKLHDLSKEIDVPPYILETAYRRLQINGIMSARSWVLSDPLLFDGEEHDPMSVLRAWCDIAGRASGYTGLGQTRDEYAIAREKYDRQ